MGCKIGANCNIELKGIDVENCIVPVILSDETQVQRYSWEDGEYYITLEHSEEAIDLQRAEILSMFVNHNTNDLPIAKFTDVRLEDKKLKANAVFDKDDEQSMKLFNKLAKGFLQSFSIGADIEEKVLEKEVNGTKYYKATKWSIYECSLVGIPAIPNAKVGLAMGTIPAESKIVNSNKGEKMDFSKENFEKLEAEKLDLEAKLTKALADMDSTKAELEKVQKQSVALEAAIAERKDIVGMAFEFGLNKEKTIELMESKDIADANAKMLELLRSNGATFSGDGSEEHFERQTDDSASIWDKL